MRYIKKRYRIFYLIPFTISLSAFCVMQTMKFLLYGNIPDVTDVTVSIEGFDGKYYKVYEKSNGDFYRGELLEKL